MEAFTGDAMRGSDGGRPPADGVASLFGRPAAVRRAAYLSGLSDRRGGERGSHPAGMRVALRTIGALAVEHVGTDAGARGSLILHPDNILVLAPVRGTARLAGGRDRALVMPGCIGLATAAGRIDVEWEPSAEGMLIKLSRHLLQERMLACAGEPRRLRALATVLRGEAGISAPLRLIHDLLLEDGGTEGCGAPAGDRLIAGLAGCVAAKGDRLSVPALALKAALDHVVHHPAEDHRLDVVARAAGVSARLLHRELGDVLGIPLSRFVSNSRIDRARQLLESGRESRSIAELARALGFSSASGFSRAYATRFGIAPSLARAAATMMG